MILGQNTEGAGFSYKTSNILKPPVLTGGFEIKLQLTSIIFSKTSHLM